MIRRVVSGSRLNPKNWFKKKKSWDELEKKDLAVLLPAEISVASLQRITLIPNHPLYLIANTAKSIIDETLADKSFNRKVDCIFRTERLLNKAIEERKLIKAKTVTASVKDTDTVATPAASSIESSTVSDVDLRLSFAHKYFSNLKNQCDSATIEAASRVSLVRLVDAIILGTSSERLLGDDITLTM